MFDCFLVVSTSAIDCLERLVSEMTYYVLSGMLVGCVAQWAERRSLAGELTLSCARPAADG